MRKFFPNHCRLAVDDILSDMNRLFDAWESSQNEIKDKLKQPKTVVIALLVLAVAAAGGIFAAHYNPEPVPKFPRGQPLITQQNHSEPTVPANIAVATALYNAK